ncbi:MAG: hypothetical protein H0T42_06360 [Deltaproteobacteria bacterium]|nr:hypothetical protein [Deltaproteobacteria bacterium]
MKQCAILDAVQGAKTAGFLATCASQSVCVRKHGLKSAVFELAVQNQPTPDGLRLTSASGPSASPGDSLT